MVEQKTSIMENRFVLNTTVTNWIT